MTTRPQYSYARRMGRTTAWLEESEIAERYRDRFRQAEDHRARVVGVLEAGAEWAGRTKRASSSERIYLDLALVCSGLAERRVDKAHIDAVTAFVAEHSKPDTGPRPSQLGGTPAVLRGRLRLEPYAAPTAAEAYADGCVYLRAEIGWSVPRGDGAAVPVLSMVGLEYWLLVQLQFAVAYAEWAGAYGDVDILAQLVGPAAMALDNTLPNQSRAFPGDVKERTDTDPVHTTSTLDALVGDPVQLVACARRLATEFLADFGSVETKLLTPDGRILSKRLDQQGCSQVETWMRAVGLPVET